jgi:hypothetical protein
VIRPPSSADNISLWVRNNILLEAIATKRAGTARRFPAAARADGLRATRQRAR